MKRQKWLLWLLLASALGIAAAVLLHEGNTAPIHYVFSGGADAYGTKWICLLFAAIPLAVLAAAAAQAGRGEAGALTARALSGLALFFMALGWLLTLSTLNGGERLPSYVLPGVLLLLGALLCWIGPALRNAEPNRLVGVRTRATLSDPDIWRKTQAFAAKTDVVGGLVMMAAAIFALLLPGVKTALLIAGGAVAALCCLLPALYARRLFQDKTRG